jgi:LytS/YehU family sensor histidine kinase
VQISIADTGGGGPAAAPRSGTGRGIELTRRRLAASYGKDAAGLHMQRRPDGFTVTVDLPANRDVT